MAPSKFDIKDSTNWSLPAINEYLNHRNGEIPKIFLMNFFDFDEAAFKAALAQTHTLLDTAGLTGGGPSSRFPSSGVGIGKRQTVAAQMVNLPSGMFRRGWKEPPAWFTDELLNPPHATTKTPVMLFQAYTNLRRKEINMKGEEEEANDEPDPKRPRLSRRGSSSQPAPKTTGRKATSIHTGSSTGRQTPKSATRTIQGKMEAMDVDDDISLGTEHDNDFIKPSLADTFMYIARVTFDPRADTLQLDRSMNGTVGQFYTSTPHAKFDWEEFLEFCPEMMGDSSWSLHYFDPEVKELNETRKVVGRHPMNTGLCKLHKAMPFTGTSVQMFLVQDKDLLRHISMEEKTRSHAMPDDVTIHVGASPRSPIRTPGTFDSPATTSQGMYRSPADIEEEYNSFIKDFPGTGRVGADSSTAGAMLSPKVGDSSLNSPRQSRPPSRVSSRPPSRVAVPTQPPLGTANPAPLRFGTARRGSSDPERNKPPNYLRRNSIDSSTYNATRVSPSPKPQTAAGLRFTPYPKSQTTAEFIAASKADYGPPPPLPTSLAAAPKATDPFPRMSRRPPPTTAAADLNGPDRPSFPLTGWTKSGWLSTAEIFTKVRDDGTVGLATRAFAADQMSPAMWTTVCEYFGFDEDDESPLSGVVIRGWQPTLPILTYQFYTAGWVVQQMLIGRPFSIIGHDMGLGKTLCAIATMTILSNTAKLGTHTGTVAASTPFQDREADARLFVGDKPMKIRNGPMLISAPSALTRNWLQEIRKFVSTRAKVVLAWDTNISTVKMNSEFSGSYRLTDLVRTNDLPTPAQLDVHFGAGNWDKHNIKVSDIIQKRPKHANPAWLNDWWVIATFDTVGKRFRPFLSKQQGERLNVHFSYCIVDEFHKMKGWTNTQWKALGNLPGQPQFIYLSGTMFESVKQLLGPFAAAYNASVYRAQTIGGSPATLYDLIDEYIKPSTSGRTQVRVKPWESLRLKMLSSDAATEQWQTDNGIFAVMKLQKETDAMMLKRTKLVDGADGTEQRDEDHDTTEEDDGSMLTTRGKELCAQLGAILNNYVIRLTSDHIWRPKPNMRGYPCVDIPPHSTFDTKVVINDKFKPDLLPLWAKALRPAYDKQAASTSFVAWSFFSSIRRFRIYTVFPCIVGLRRQHPALKAELGRMVNEQGEAIMAKGRDSELYKHMAEFHKLESMATLLSIITGVRAQTNTFGHPRKIGVAGFVPFIAAVVYIYFLWLADQPDQPVFESEDDICFVGSWEHTSKRNQTIDLFKTTPVKAEYTDEPGTLVATASSIEVGLSLNPADCMIVLDSEWTADKIVQVIGRVRRARFVQPAPFTEGYRLICSAPWCHLQEWIAGRQLNTTVLQNSVRLEIDHLPEDVIVIDDDDAEIAKSVGNKEDSGEDYESDNNEEDENGGNDGEM